MAKKMTDGVRKAVEVFCLTGGIYTCILLALNFSHTTDMTEKRVTVFVIIGFALVSMVYCFTRILTVGQQSSAESKKSKDASDQ
jgi:hypothetical protein